MTDTTSTTQSPTAALSAAGVSIWLDDLSRERINSGGLQKLIAEKNVVGVTTNPTIFAAALAKGEAYDEQVRELAAAGASVEDAIFEITTDDVANASDIFREVYEALERRRRPRLHRGGAGPRPRRAAAPSRSPRSSRRRSTSPTS